VCLVELASVQRPQLVARAIADSLRLKEAAERDVLDALIDFLGAKRVLLVLDNLEHLTHPADPALRGLAQPVIGSLLRRCPNLKVLATSRVRLRADGERTHEVKPFDVPAPAAAYDLDALKRNAAVALFVERTRDSRSDFELDATNAEPIVQICRAVDGIPLAIELAAAKSDLLTPEAVASVLRERSLLDELVEGPLDRPPRHHTLRATIDWSYGLLDPRRQRFLANLGIFTGGCTAAAAAAISPAESQPTPEDRRDVPALLGSLVDANLVRVVATPDGPRYTLLETIREYAQDQLRTAGTDDTVANRHAHYYVDLAERLEPELVGHDSAIWLTACELDHANIRAALEWLIGHAAAEPAARLAAALWRFWSTHGHLTEGRAWLEAVLAHGEQLPPPLRVRVLNGAGVLARAQRALERATAVLTEALALARHIGDDKSAALALVNLGIVAENLMEYELARDRYLDARALYQQLGDARGEAHVLDNLAVVAIDEGRFPEASDLALESLAIFDRTGVDQRGKALVQRNLGWIALAQRNFVEAHRWLDASLALSRELGDAEGEGNVLNNLAFLTYAEADGEPDYRRAARYASDGLRALHELADHTGVAESLEILAACAARLDAPESAARAFGAAEALRAAVQTFHFPSYRALYRAMVADARRQMERHQWDLLWAEGRAQPDAVVAEALAATL
jgi:predicted ATPase